MPINEDNLCVLRRNTNNSLFSIEYVPVEILNKADLTELYTRLNDQTLSGSEIYNYIKNHPTLNVLFKPYNFCVDLYGTCYEGEANNNMYNLTRLEEHFSNPHYRKRVLLRICERRALAYSLEKAYRDCESNNTLLAFSHRRIGWAEKPYQLDDSFTIEFKTNFGFGNSSYFYTKLKYKEIEIVPISEWVHYRYANLYEIISASAVHSVTHESWNQALGYGRDACNLFIRNKNEFVNQYLKQECEKLMTGLYEIKTKAKFKLRENHDRFNPIFKEIDFTGSELIAFRGEKISGSLDIIDSIRSLENILSIANYINRIESYNREIEPSLESELKNISRQLPLLKDQFAGIESNYDQLKEKDNEYDEIRSMLREELNMTGEYLELAYDEKLEYMQSRFLEKYPEYPIFQKQLDDTKEQYYALSSKIRPLENSLYSIEKSIAKIKAYFEDLGPNNQNC